MLLSVEVRVSTIPNAGNGLFALKSFHKGEFICYYSGKLIDWIEAQYMDPTYLVNFEFGKGFRLHGDCETNDFGHLVNSTHISCPHVQSNARFDFKKKKIFSNGRGQFSIVATKDTAENEEIIVNYGKGYWNTLERYKIFGPPICTTSTLERNERALRRKRLRDNDMT